MNGVLVLVSFLRILASLMVTSTLGPIISTIAYMFKDMLTFFAIWAIVLTAYVCAGALTYPNTPRILNMEEGFIFWIESSLGNWDVGIFDHLIDEGKPTQRLIGVWFLLTFVLINLLILVNVVIAMMADTYALMTSVRKGVYNFNIIQTASAYKIDKYYGGLVICMPPFCAITFLLLPFYIGIKDKEKLKVFNERVL